MGKPSILFAYGAGSGSGGRHAASIEKMTGIKPTVLNWAAGDPHFAVPPSMGAYMQQRLQDAPADARDPRPEAGALGPGQWAWEHLRPDWRRGALRAVYGGATGSWPVIADALNYLHNGHRHVDVAKPIVRDWAAKADAPRVVIGLSLGGLILADAMAQMAAEDPHVPVDLLVTAGSQAGIIFISDAMAVLRRTTGEGPTPFEPWLNIWNRDDYLSWPLEGSLIAGGRIRDREVEAPDLSFPETHSEYFDIRDTYRHIGEALGIGDSLLV